MDVRIVATSNRDLAAEVKAGESREDLSCRFAVIDLAVPPLRERCEDIPALVAHFIALLSRRLGVSRKTLDRKCAESGA